MSRVRVESFAISIDGYGAGPDQSRDHPLGVGGTALHEWAIPTRTFQKHVFGNPKSATPEVTPYILVGVLRSFFFFGKVVFIIFVFMWVRWTIPRFRYDQLMHLGWRILIPLALFNMLVTGALVLFFDK